MSDELSFIGLVVALFALALHEVPPYRRKKKAAEFETTLGRAKARAYQEGARWWELDELERKTRDAYRKQKGGIIE